MITEKQYRAARGRITEGTATRRDFRIVRSYTITRAYWATPEQIRAELAS